MKKTALFLLLVTTVALPTFAEARTVTLTTMMQNYGGNNAYLAIYLTDANKKFHSTIWVAGGQTRYYRHLRDWRRGSANESGIDGVTGASVGSGSGLRIKVDIADSLIDAGYQIRIDSAVEEVGESPADIIAPLDSANSGKAFDGKNFVKSFQFDM